MTITNKSFIEETCGLVMANEVLLKVFPSRARPYKRMYGSTSKTAVPDQPPPTIFKFRRRPSVPAPNELVSFRPPEVGNEA